MDFGELWALYVEAIEAAIRLTCARWRLNAEEAQELESLLWLTALRDDGLVLRRFEGRSGIRTYLYKVMKGAAHNWIRARSRRRQHERPAGDTYSNFADRRLTDVDPETRVLEIETRRARRRALRGALMKLSPLERDVLRLRAQGEEIAAIGIRLGVSPVAAKNPLYRAIARLRGELAPPDKRARQDTQKRRDS